MDSKPVELSESQWADVKIAINRGVRGDLALKATLNRMYPRFEFGLFSEEDLDDRVSNYGWVIFTAEHWAAKLAWNEHAGARHGIKEKDGALMHKDCYICARPINIGDTVRSKINTASEDQYERARGSKAKQIKVTAPSGEEVPVGQSLTETTTNRDPANPLSYRESDADEGPHVYGEGEAEPPKRGRRPKET